MKALSGYHPHHIVAIHTLALTANVRTRREKGQQMYKEKGTSPYTRTYIMYIHIPVICSICFEKQCIVFPAALNPCLDVQ